MEGERVRCAVGVLSRAEIDHRCRVAAILRHWREEAGLSREELAARINVSAITVYRYEERLRGEPIPRLPRIDYMVRWALACGSDPHRILDAEISFEVSRGSGRGRAAPYLQQHPALM